jgi:hypothetical protein
MVYASSGSDVWVLNATTTVMKSLQHLVDEKLFDLAVQVAVGSPYDSLSHFEAFRNAGVAMHGWSRA